MRTFEDRYRGFEQRPRRTLIGWGLSIFLIVGVLWGIGSLAFGGLNLLSQPGRVIQKTFDADNMVANYEWFRTQFADIGAMDTKLANAVAARTGFEDLAGPRAGWKLSDRQEWDQLNRIVLGLQNQRATMVAAYNGRASQTNRSIFINPPIVGGPVLPERVE